MYLFSATKSIKRIPARNVLLTKSFAPYVLANWNAENACFLCVCSFQLFCCCLINKWWYQTLSCWRVQSLEGETTGKLVGKTIPSEAKTVLWKRLLFFSLQTCITNCVRLNFLLRDLREDQFVGNPLRMSFLDTNLLKPGVLQKYCQYILLSRPKTETAQSQVELF